MNGDQYTVAVFGGSGVPQESQAAKEARRLGRLLAEAGYRVSNGGYMGVMEACSRGAREAGGYVIGVTCAQFADRKPNPHLDEEICEPDLTARIATLMRISDAYIVLDGQIGTLAELFLAWNLIHMGWKKPLIVVGASMRRVLDTLAEQTEIDADLLRHIRFVDAIDEAVERIKD